jgi:predicted Zn-dependent protease
MHPTDFEVEAGVSFGEWLHSEIDANVHLERNGFMPDRVRAVAARLQQNRPDSSHFIVEIPWLDSFSAFTAPGRYIYFGRRLLERCPDEDSTAFVIAHEIAHHDLGHLSLFSGPFSRHAARLQAGALAILFFRLLQKRIYSPEWELAADRRAIELCLEAGYDGVKCLRVFRILELVALDYGDLGMVFGLDPASERELSPEASVMTKARIWLYQRRRGYLPIQDRLAMARDHLESLVGHPVTLPFSVRATRELGG